MAFSLTESAAVEAVRKNIDEYPSGNNVLYGEDITSDNASLDATIKKTLPEAINAIHKTAPLSMLEGLSTSFVSRAHTSEAPYYNDIVAGTGSATPTTITILTRKHVLRVVECKASDSDIMPDVVPEDSPEGRKQLDSRLCGTFDKPVLVVRRGTDTDFKYYSHKTSAGTITSFTYIEPVYYSAPSGTTENSYPVCDQLREAVINQLTGMVLAIFGKTDAAQYFFGLNANK